MRLSSISLSLTLIVGQSALGSSMADGLASFETQSVPPGQRVDSPRGTRAQANADSRSPRTPATSVEHPQGLGKTVAAAGALPEGLLLVSEMDSPSRVRIFDPTGGTILYDYVVDLYGDEGCDQWLSYEYGGSFGLLALGDSLSEKPSYMFDAVLHPGDEDLEIKFSRDVDYLPDGSLLLTDAGCELGCKERSRSYRVRPFYYGAEPSGKGGYYTPDHAHQEMVEVPEEAVIGDYACGLGALFEAQWIPGEALGQQLRDAAGQSRRMCE